jgi:hexokinase
MLAEETDRLTADDGQLIQTMADRVIRWIKSYRKDAATRNLAKMDAGLGQLITPDKIAEFDRSEPALTAIKCLGEVMDGSVTEITQSMYTVMRDFLLTQIVVTNANRSGVLANMSVDEFNAVRQTDGSFVVSVTKHKTASTYGPAKVVLSKSLHSWLSVFVSKVRPNVAYT